jgi:hypothetical protein
MAAKSLCSVPGCGKPLNSRGWCIAHYRRWQWNGDPLAGRTPDGDPEQFYRNVVLAYSGDECLKWPYARNSRGYPQMKLNGRFRLLARVLCEAVHGPAPTPEHEAAHSCGNGHEGCLTQGHLSWKTPVENAADRVTHGTETIGERHGMAKLTKSEVRLIRSLGGEVSQRALAARFGVSQGQIHRILSGKSWAP